MIGMVDLSKKGTGIHGIVEEYVAKGNISAGGFVKYLEEFEAGEGTEIESIADVEFKVKGYSIKAVALDSNRVFIAHTLGDAYDINGVVCTILNDTITIGTEVELTSYSRAVSKGISIVALSENKIFITYNKSDSSHTYYHLYGIICDIDNTTITIKKDKILNSDKYSAFCVSAVLLSENKVFIAHSGSDVSNCYLYGAICTISNDDIIIEINTKLSDEPHSGYEISAITLSENKVFIAHSYNVYNDFLYGMICNINNNEIVAGSDVQLNSMSYSGYQISAVKLSDNKVFIAHSYNTDYYLYGTVCSILNDTITKEVVVKLSTDIYAGYQISVVALIENKVFIAHSIDKNEHYLNVTICTISDTAITVDKYKQLSTTDETGYQISAVKLSNNRVFIAHQYTGFYRYVGATLCVTGRMVKKVTKLETLADKIFGIAQNKALDGQAVKVVRPNYNESEEN